MPEEAYRARVVAELPAGMPVVAPGSEIALLGSTEAFRFALAVKAPAREGDYRCELDLVHEGITWFSDKGSDATRFSVSVRQDPNSTLVDISTDRAQSVGENASAPSGLPDIYDGLPSVAEDPGAFPMHGIHREAVLKLIDAHGAQLLRVEEDERCGKEWFGYRYFVRR
jgi:hypothetical protein